MKVPFKVDLSDKTVAITGAGGVICSAFAKALASCGAKVALLDINYDAAKAVADEIGDSALAVKCNCLDKASIAEAKDAVVKRFGKVNFLINGAGGNNPRASTDNETMTPDLTGMNRTLSPAELRRHRIQQEVSYNRFAINVNRNNFKILFTK